MITLLRKYSIRVQLLTIGAAMLLLLFGTFLWSYDQMRGITYKRNSEYTLELISTIQKNIADNADSINRILPNIAYNETIQRFLMERERLAQFELQGGVEALLVNLQSMKQGIDRIVLLSTVGGGFYNCVNCKDYIPFSDIPDQTNAYYSGLYRFKLSSPTKNVVYVGTPVYDKKNVVTIGKKIGYAVIVLEADAIAPQLGSMSTHLAGRFYVLDRNGIVVTSNDASSIGQPIGGMAEEVAQALQVKEGEPVKFQNEEGDFILHARPVPAIGGSIISVFETADLFSGLKDMLVLVLGIFALSVVILYAFYTAISRNILNPIRAFMKIISGLRSQGLDNPNKRVSLDGYAEISIMARQFNTLLDEIDDLAAKLVDSKTYIYELKLLRKQAELQFLKNQINPHFLYNTLETIKGIAYVKNVPEIREMTDSLGLIFRYSIKGGDDVRFEEELAIVNAYIRIQQIRFQDRFDVVYDVDERSLRVSVIKMILQPLVENAVFHGIEPSLERCRLTVGSRIEGGSMLIWVQDDGVGIEPAQLDDIRTHIEDKSGPDLTSDIKFIGMLNVNNRIRYAYGPAYGIVSVESEPSNGTRVVIKVPCGGMTNAV
ncbi:sensor histidine kinase [Paenibacillus sp. 843]|uniref:cache domain-containing sensor histidine kinase n=1 Tax=Paenibacillus sp. 843 TaxID=3341795 RepID=UPI00372CB84E